MFSKVAMVLSTSIKHKPWMMIKSGQYNSWNNSFRNLITPSVASNTSSLRPFTEVLEETQKKHISKQNNGVEGQCRKFLSALLPPSQESLPPRTMEDSFIQAIIPIGSNPDVRLQYTSHIGGARLGRLVQDMDNFAAVVVYKYIDNPLQEPEGPSAYAVVTARMDHLHIREDIKNDADIKLVGHVTWVGASSAEVGVGMEQMDDGVWKKVCEAKFVMVARDAATGTKSAPINPMVVKTGDEEILFELGKKNIALRAKADQDSLFKEPPSTIESNLIHNMFLSTVDHKVRSFAARVKPENSTWMTDSKLKSVMMCEPEHKNDYNKIFGGLIMEKCIDLAFTNTWVFTGAVQVPVCTHIDDVIFLKAVEIGDLLYFHSQVVFTHETLVQARVSAEVLDRETKRLKLTNVLQVTFKLPSEVPHVIPQSYHEAMAYLTGRRHFLISLENEGLLAKGMAEKEMTEVSKYTPLWMLKELDTEEHVFNKHNVQDMLGEDTFMEAEITRDIRARESGLLS
eukprot:GFUD01029005.1.p1 GENE.GFUD01029005.1~~GFUD01029005.1.p1  ORF type:complete len:512 (-),score=111.14 GFUD01029005.1:129-1664(-)